MITFGTKCLYSRQKVHTFDKSAYFIRTHHTDGETTVLETIPRKPKHNLGIRNIFYGPFICLTGTMSIWHDFHYERSVCMASVRYMYHDNATAEGSTSSSLPTCCAFSCSLLRAATMAQRLIVWCWWSYLAGLWVQILLKAKKWFSAFEAHFMILLPMQLSLSSNHEKTPKIQFGFKCNLAHKGFRLKSLVSLKIVPSVIRCVHNSPIQDFRCHQWAYHVLLCCCVWMFWCYVSVLPH